MAINREKIWHKYREFARLEFSDIGLDRPFFDFVSQLNAIVRNAEDAELRDQWQNFTIHVDHDYDGYVDDIVICGEQLETDEEYAVRIAKAEKYQARALAAKKKISETKRVKEYKQYLKLKEKFENDSSVMEKTKDV